MAQGKDIYTWRNIKIVINRIYDYMCPSDIDMWGYVDDGQHKTRFCVGRESNLVISYPDLYDEDLPKALIALYKKLRDERKKLKEQDKERT